MAEMTIREVQQEDNPFLEKIIKGVFTEFDAPKNGTVYSDPTTGHLFELFRVKNAHLYIAEKNNEIIGCCGIYPTESLPTNCLEIVKFYIKAEGRGKGYGKKLYETCEKMAIKLGYQQLYIESIPSFKTAIDMYKKLGFIQLSTPLGSSGHFGCDLWFLKTFNK